MNIEIIVTVYNLEKELNSCLTSIATQSYSNISVIIVNDGSKDRSKKIINDFCLNDRRFRSVHIENSGVTAARKKGLELSCADYVMFVDGDDELPKDSLEKLLNHAEKSEFDIIIGSYATIYSNKVVSHICNPAVLNGFELAERMISGEIMGSPCMRLYRKKLFSSDSFNLDRDIVRGEDLLMNLELCSRVNKVRIIDDVVYFYNMRSSSTMNSFITTLDYELNFRHRLTAIVNYYNFKQDEKNKLTEALRVAEIKGLIYSFYSNLKNSSTTNHENIRIKNEIKSKHVTFVQFNRMRAKFKLLYIAIVINIPLFIMKTIIK